MRSYWIFIWIIGTIVSCTLRSEQKRERFVVQCDAENVIGNNFTDVSGAYKLSNGLAQSDVEAYNGSYSLKLTENNPFGMAIVLNDMAIGDKVNITVWRKGGGNGHICASKVKSSDFYQSTNKILSSEKSWEKLNLAFTIPNDYSETELKIYLWNAGKEPIYFDDLIIDITPKKQENLFATEVKSGSIKIFIDDKGMQKLRMKRAIAMQNGLLESGDDDWVKGIIFYQNEFLNARLRLKGDHLDHLQGDKWSFRVKLKGEGTFNGMKTFSIQTPAARNYLHEWFFHKVLEQEDMLTTRYGFVPVVLNGKKLGVYAWEEHFEKQLVEHKRRREGPILKLTDDAYWLDQKVKRKFNVDYSISAYDASVIVPFGQGKTIKDEVKRKQFNEGKDLYFQYKYAYAQASEIFDVKKMAQYYAMMDATNSYHSEHWFNQRFYYNPVLCKLEPISFDCFADVGIYDYYGANLLIEKAEKTLIDRHLKLFADQVFQDYYFKFLAKYSDLAFWQKAYGSHKNELEELNGALAKEFPKYKFDINKFYEVANQAETSLKEFTNREIFNQFHDRIMGVQKEYKGKAEMELFPHLVHAYRNSPREIEIYNLFSDSIKIIGVGNKRDFIQDFVENISVLPANSQKPFKVKFKVEEEKARFLFLEVRGMRQVISVYPWSAPEKTSAYQQLLKSAHNPFPENSDTIFISGKYVIDKPVVVPRGKCVFIGEGAEIDFVKSSTFISYSPLFIDGKKDAPVLIYSSDKSCKGFNVLQAEKRSELKNVTFDGLSNLNYGGWITPAAVCFYESDVTMNEVTFSNNHNCDDALNVVRSDFYINKCRFENAFADAFDSDFCTGEVMNTVFSNPGNDAIDFSGSKVKITNCTIKNAADKGISGGEKSHLKVTNCTINSAKIGVASKDESTVEIYQSTLKNTTYALVAFQKKSEYGSGTIKAEDISLQKYLFMHLIEEKSMLYLNGKEIFGKEPKVAERFY